MNRHEHTSIWLRFLAKNEVRLARSSYRLLRDIAKNASDAYRIGGQNAAEEVLTLSEADMQHVLMRSYGSVSSEIIPYTFRTLGLYRKATFQEIVRGYLEQEALKKARMITNTTFSVMRNIIIKGNDQELSAIQIASNIRGVLDSISVNRARTIARTESHNAATYAMQEAAEEAAEELELEMNREWVTITDGREREAHKDADTQVVGLDEPFYVDGEYIDRPGEGDASNSINCRCTIIYIPA